MDDFVQYVVVRRDIGMGIGKTAAQVAHASLGVLLNGGSLIDGYNVRSWLNGRFTKIVVYVKSKEKLLNLCKKLDEDNIRTKLIYDCCLTDLKPEESNGTILTCMGVAPLNTNCVPKYLKKLRLLV